MTYKFKISVPAIPVFTKENVVKKIVLPSDKMNLEII